MRSGDGLQTRIADQNPWRRLGEEEKGEGFGAVVYG